MQSAHDAFLALAQIHFLPSLQNRQEDGTLQGVTEALVPTGMLHPGFARVPLSHRAGYQAALYLTNWAPGRVGGASSQGLRL